MLAQLRARLTYANVMATAAVFIALGGSSYAALTVTGKNVKNSSLTGKDIKNSSLTGSDVKNNRLTGADVSNLAGVDVKDNGLTGADLLESSLGLVPSANTANNIAAPEAYREVGTPGNPAFGPDCDHYTGTGILFERVAFYKDREGVVHLKGAVNCTGSTPLYAFQLPPGYRPRNGKILNFITPSSGPDLDGVLLIGGAGIGPPGTDGTVQLSAAQQLLDGVTFRAEG